MTALHQTAALRLPLSATKLALIDHARVKRSQCGRSNNPIVFYGEPSLERFAVFQCYCDGVFGHCVSSIILHWYAAMSYSLLGQPRVGIAGGHVATFTLLSTTRVVISFAVMLLYRGKFTPTCATLVLFFMVR